MSELSEDGYKIIYLDETMFTTKTMKDVEYTNKYNRIKIPMKKKNHGEEDDKFTWTMTTAVEYLAAEILEVSGKRALELNASVVTPHHLTFAIKNDKELNKLLFSAKTTPPPPKGIVFKAGKYRV